MTEALTLDEEIREAVAAAPGERNSMTVAYIGSDGWPHLSPRSSVVVLDDQTLGLWARKPTDGLAAAISQHQEVSLLFSDFVTRGVMYTFYGVAKVSESVEVSEKIWRTMPEIEREIDSDRNGVAIVVDLTKVVAMGRRPERNFTMER